MSLNSGSKPPRVLLMANQQVGAQIATWLFAHYPDDLALVVTIDEDAIWAEAKRLSIPAISFESEFQVDDHFRSRGNRPDLGLLVWWPRIVKETLLELPEQGFVNTHPSYLPYNRGKHYNFWAIVENAPFGVTLHKVARGIDSGEIVSQNRISYDWTDTGGTLYEKATLEMVRLFQSAYPTIRKLDIPTYAQDVNASSFHHSSELAAASRIDLDQPCTPRDLLNRMRARTFSGHPACWFEEDGVRYEVRTEIRKVNHESS